MKNNNQAIHGILLAIAAYTMWGVAPVYFKLIESVSAMEILVHRVIWSCLLLFLILFITKQWNKLAFVFKQPKLLSFLAISAIILLFNWGLFIWAVTNGHILDASLGYYINPLLNVMLGMLFLGERLTRLQKFALLFAVSGVVIQLISFGSFPLIAFALAGSFAIYGLMRKKVAVDSLVGLLTESILLLPLAVAYWCFFVESNTANMLENTWVVNSLLVAAGIVTTAPLLCFIGGARRLQYSTMGILQYIGPSIMFILAVNVYGEPLETSKLMSFGFIWCALGVFTYDAWRKRVKPF